MSKSRSEAEAELKDWMRQSANRAREMADGMALEAGGCDDPHHPWGIAKDEEGNQLFTDWIDFVEQVARPLVEAEGNEEAVQKAMALYRKECPYFICVSLVMALNRVNQVNPYLKPISISKDEPGGAH